MRLIDSDALMERMKEIYTDADQRTLYSEIWRVVSHAPAIDAVPVVRCGECKYYAPPQGFCYVVQGTPREDFYCAAGKRRDTDGKDD